MRNWRKLFILGILTLLVSNLMTPLTLRAENAADQNDGEPEGEVIKVSFPISPGSVSYTHLLHNAGHHPRGLQSEAGHGSGGVRQRDQYTL